MPGHLDWKRVAAGEEGPFDPPFLVARRYSVCRQQGVDDPSREVHGMAKTIAPQHHPIRASWPVLPLVCIAAASLRPLANPAAGPLT